MFDETDDREESMTDQPETKDCPFCSEQILATAKKCKHCGEWLDGSTNRAGAAAGERGSSDARAVTKGLKEKEYHDQMIGCGGFVGLVAAIAVGYWLASKLHSSAVGWTVGIIIFFGVIALLGKWYWKE
jgi:hypothetical protein